MTEQSSGAVDATTETAPEKGAAEQEVVEQTQPSFEETLLKMAQEEGLIAPAKPGDPAKREEEEPVSETPAEGTESDQHEETEQEKEEQDAEEKADEQKPKPDPKLEKLVPLREVIEERGKKKIANERAERLEGELSNVREQLVEAQRQLAQASGPMPTPDNPLIDVQDPIVLDRLERVYEALEEVDIETVNEDGTVTVPAAIGKDGKLVYQNIPPDQARIAQKRADRVLRKDIPRRREYLTQRAQNDATAEQLYPDLKNGEHQFTQLVTQLTSSILSGKAMSDPQVKFWAANAVYGYMKRSEEAKSSNGKHRTPDVEEIVESARRKPAPTVPRTRTLGERKSGAKLAEAQAKFEKEPTPENAEALVQATLSQGSRQKTVQPVAE